MNNLKVICLLCFLANLYGFIFTKAYCAGNFLNLPITENKGNIKDLEGKLHPEIQFSTRFNGIDVFFSARKIHYLYRYAPSENINVPRILEATPQSSQSIPQRIQNYRIDLDFIGANPNVKIIPQNLLSSLAKYYFGYNTAAEARQFGSILYQDLYPGIDLLITSAPNATREGLKYDFILRPGADPNNIRLKYSDKAVLGKEGEVVLNHLLGTLQESAPIVWQTEQFDYKFKDIAPAQKLPSQWILDTLNNVLQFKISGLDKNKFTIIDPLVWGTYHGGTAADTSYAVVTDNQGNSYIAGVTYSANFISTPGSSFGGQADAFVAKRDAIGGLLWSLFLGGSAYDAAYNIHFNAQDNSVMIVGATESTNFPATNGTLLAGQRDALLARLDLNGNLLQASYYGGAAFDYALSGVFTPASCNLGNTYFAITGATRSDNLPGASANFYADGFDFFVTTFDNNLSPQTVRYFGGANNDVGNDIIIDPVSCAYVVAGVTQSRFLSVLPAGPGSYTKNMGAGDPADIYILRLQSNLSPIWSTYWGGSGSEWDPNLLKNCALAIDSNQNIFLAGNTASPNLTTTAGAYQRNFGSGGAVGSGSGQGARDGFIAKFSSSNTLSWASYYGGGNNPTGADYIQKIVIDRADNVIITGSSNDNGFPFRTSAQSPDSRYSAAFDMVVAKIENATSQVIWSSFLGAEGNDYGWGLAVDNNNAIYVSGVSTSNLISFPSGSPGIPNRGSGDAVVLKIEDCQSKPSEPFVSNAPLVRCGSGSLTLNFSVSAPDVPLVRIFARQSDLIPIGEARIRPFTFTTPTLNTSTTYFIESQYFPGCASARIPVAIDVFAVPAPPLVANRIVCQAGNDNFTVSMGNPAGSGIRLYTEPTSGTPIAEDRVAPYEFPYNVTTNTTLYAESFRPESPTCVSSRTAFSIEVSANLATPEVDKPELCGVGTVVFTIGPGNSNITGMRLYENQFGGVILQEDRTAPYNFTVPATEVKTYYVESFLAAVPNECRSRRAPIVVYPRPNTPNVASVVSRCGPGRLTLSAALSNGTPFTQVNWYAVPVLGSPLQTKSASDPDFNYTTPALAATTTYYVEANEVRLPGCVSPRAQVVAEILPIPEAPALSQNTLRLCSSGNPAIPVTVTLPVTTSSPVDELRLLDGGGNLVQNFRPGFSFNSHTLVWNVFSSGNFSVESVARGCTSSTHSSLSVTVLSTIGRAFAADISRCGPGAVTLTFTQSEPRGTTINLYTSASAAQPVFQTSSANATFTIPNVSSTVTYYIESFDPSVSPSCPMQPRSPVQITINAVPDEPTVNDNPVLCGPSNASIPFTLGAAIPGNAIRIYTQPFGLEPPVRTVIPAVSPATLFVNTTTTYYLESLITATGCASSRRAAVVTVRPIPNDPVVTNAKRCGNGAVTFSVSALASTGARLALYTVSSGGSAIATVALQANQSSYQILSENRMGITNLSTTVIYFIAVEDVIVPTFCQSNRVPVIATWYPLPQSATISVTPTALCVGRSATIAVTYNNPEARYQWSGAGIFPVQTSDPNYTINPLQLVNNGSVQVAITVPDVVGCTPGVVSANLEVNDTTLNLSTNAPICEGNTLVVRANSIPNATYQWSAPAGIPRPLPATATLVFNNIRANQVGEFTLTAAIPGCPTQIRRINTSLYQKPVITGSSSVCLNNSIPLSVPNLSNVFYSWRVRSGEPFLSTNSGPNVRFQPLSDASLIGRSFIVEVVANYPSAGCVLDTTLAIRINDVPQILNVTASNNNQPICQGKPLTLDVILADTPPPGTTYRWQGPGNITGTSSTLQIPALTPQNSGNYTITVTYPGCPSVSAVSPLINVTPLPPSPQVFASDLICVGDVLRLSTNVNFPGATFNWIGPNGFTSTLAAPILNITNVSQAGSYQVAVTYPGCEPVSNVPGKLVRVNAPAIGPARTNQPLCKGSTLYLSAPDAQDATYEWSGPNNFSSTDKNPSIASVSSLHQGVYRVRVQVRSCPVQDFFTEPVEVMPEVSLTSNSPLCENMNLSLTATQIQEATYLWLGPNNQRIAGNHALTLRNLSLDQSGEYTVLTFWKGCTTYNKTTVLVNPKPALELRSNSPICEGRALRLTLLHLNPVQGAIYSWDRFPAQNQTQILVPVATRQLGGLHTATVTVPGCEPSSVAAQVVINEPFQGSGIFSNSPLCEGSTLQLSTDFFAPAAQYYWTGPQSFIAQVQNPSLTGITTLNEGEYTLRVSVPGCETRILKSFVVINKKPEPPIVSNNGPLCTGQRIELKAVGPANASYIWQGPNNFFSNQPVAYIDNAELENAGTYILTQNMPGCGENIVTTNVVVRPGLRAGSNSPLCAGQSLQLTATFIPGAAYLWSGPSGFTSTEQNPVIANVSTQNAGIYSVAIALNGSQITQACDNSIPQTRVAINDPSDLSIFSNAPICQGQTLVLTAFSKPGNFYAWSGPGDFSEKARISETGNVVQIPNVATLNSGRYTVQLPGCDKAQSIDIRINEVPSIAVAASSNSPLCSSDTLQLQATTIEGALYRWVGPGGFTSTEQNPRIGNLLTSNSGLYSVVVTIPACTTLGASTRVTVREGVKASVTSPVCVGQTAVFTASSILGARYFWSGPSGFSSTLQNPTLSNVTVARSGVYTVTALVEDTTLTNSCAISQFTVRLQVNDFSTGAQPRSNSPLCEGQTLQLTADFIGGVEYQWEGPNRFSTTERYPVIANATTLNSGMYTLRVKGCNIVATTMVEINKIPKIAPSSNSPLCENQNLFLLTPPDPGVSYKWIGPSGFSSTLQNPVLESVTTSASGNYILEAVFRGCTTSKAIDVLVNPAVLQAPFSNSPVCIGDTIRLFAPSVTGGSYLWSGPLGFGSIEQAPNLLAVSTEQSGVYNVKVTYPGCSMQILSTEVAIFLPPTSPLPTSNTPVCEEERLFFNAAEQPNYVSYLWQGPNGFIALEQNPSIINVTKEAAGLYTLTVSSPGCPPAQSQHLVTVIELPQLQPRNNGPFCNGGALVLEAAPQFLPDAVYFWSGPSGFVSTAASPTLAPVSLANAGVYEVTVARPGCRAVRGTTRVEVTEFDVQVSANKLEFCVGDTLRLLVAPIPNASYFWSGPQGFSSTLQNPIIAGVTTLNQGVYTCRVEVPGCLPKSSNIAIKVNLPPQHRNLTNQFACVGGSFTLCADSIAGAAYQWAGPSNFTLNGKRCLSLNGLLASNAGVYSLSIITRGCPPLIRPFELTVNERPRAGLISTNSPVCSGQEMELRSRTVMGGVEYRWQGANNFNVNRQVVRFPVFGNGRQIYTLSVLIPGCDVYTEATTVEYYTLTPRFSALSDKVCEGETAFGNINVNGVGPWRVWVGNNQRVDTLEAATMPFIYSSSAQAPGLYSLLRVEDANGCVATPNITQTVSVFSRPQVRLAQMGCGAEFEIRVSNTSQPWEVSYSIGQSNRKATGIGQEVLTFPFIENANTVSLHSITVFNQGKICTYDLADSLILLPSLAARAITQDTVICSTTSLPIVLQTGGEAPWQVDYTINGVAASRLISNLEAGKLTWQERIEEDTQIQIIRVSDSKGCFAQLSQTIKITIAKSDAIFLASEAAVCAGRPALLPIRLTGIAPWVVTYRNNGNAQTIRIGNRASSSPSLETLFINAQENARIELISLTDGAGCVRNLPAAGNRIFDLRVLDISQVTPTIVGENQVCPGSSVTWEATALPEVQNYIWQGPGGFISQGSRLTLSSPNAEAGVYSVIGIFDGCSTREATQTLRILTKPAAQMSANSKVCIGEQANIKLLFAQGRAPYRFTLLKNEGNASFTTTYTAYSSDTSISFSVTRETVFTLVSVADANGCVNAEPQQLAISIENANCCRAPAIANIFSQAGGREAALQIQPTIGAVCYHVEIYNASNTLIFTNLIPEGGNRNLIVSNLPGGRYFARVRANCSACSPVIGNFSDWSRFYEFELNALKSGILQLQAKPLSLYPNPSDGLINIELEIQEQVPFAFKVYDLNGKLVAEGEKNLEAGENRFQFDFSNLSPSVYLFEYSLKGVTYAAKLVIR
jgi:hypothetical protein